MRVAKLKKYYDNVNYVSNNGEILRCEKYYEKMLYQIYYYDFSGNWLEKDFEMKTYLNSLFIEDYYSNSGYLQWNYYLVLLYNSHDQVESKRISDIERNEDFARKFVINSKDLDNWLNDRYNIVSEELTEINQDLGILWMNKLEEKNLDCIYSRNLDIKEGVKNYLEGQDVLKPLDEALRLYQHALNILENSLGMEHPETAIALCDMAEFYLGMERYDEALPLFERSLKIFESKLGSDHPNFKKAEKNIQAVKEKMKEK